MRNSRSLLTRQNGFAQVHHTQGVDYYQDPNSWRSQGDLWSYEHLLKKAGILKPPEIYRAEMLQAIYFQYRKCAVVLR